MKKLITITLCAALLAASVPLQAQEAPPPKPTEEEKSAGVLAAFVIACLIGGAWIIWKVKQAHPDIGSKATLVLEKSTDMVVWVPVVTNTVILTNNEWVEMFRAEIDKLREPNAYFRARRVKD